MNTLSAPVFALGHLSHRERQVYFYSFYSTLRLSTKNSRPAVIVRAVPPHAGQQAFFRSTVPSYPQPRH